MQRAVGRSRELWDVASTAAVTSRFAADIGVTARADFNDALVRKPRYWVLPERHGEAVNSLVLSPDAQFIVSGSKDDTVRMWSTASGRELHKFTGHINDVTCVAMDHWDPIARRVDVKRGVTYIASGSWDRTVRVWKGDLGSGTWHEQSSYVRDGHQGTVMAVALKIKLDLLVTGSRDKTIRAWQLSSGTLLCDFAAHTGEVTTVAISADDQYVVSSSDDRIIHMWRMDGKVADRSLTMTKEKSMSGHTLKVRTVAISGNSKYIASGSNDCTVRLWSVDLEKEMKCLTEHTGIVTSVLFTDIVGSTARAAPTMSMSSSLPPRRNPSSAGAPSRGPA